ncbi:MAG: hypothetical protein WCF85_20135 [Rhodospirillaceae bacterium]
MDEIKITYHLIVKSGQTYEFVLVLDAATALSINKPTAGPAGWTDLTFHQCPHCPLSPAEVKSCPVGLAIESVIVTLGFLVSHEIVELEVTTQERCLRAKVPAQNAISSLLGLTIATSACPHTAFLRPMARFHMPLASLDETVFRVIGTFLIGEFIRAENTGAPINRSLECLIDIYLNLEIMNKALAARINAAGSLNEAGVNGLIILNTYAQFMQMLTNDSLSGIRSLFDAYLNRSLPSLSEPARDSPAYRI